MARFRVKLKSYQVHAGEALLGTITCPPGERPRSVHARWVTEGKGTPDEGDPLEATLRLRDDDSFEFEIPLPFSPRSYDGQNIKIRWHLLVVGSRHLLVDSDTEKTDVSFEVLAPRAGRDSPYRSADG
jgi:hypothetical protein